MIAELRLGNMSCNVLMADVSSVFGNVTVDSLAFSEFMTRNFFARYGELVAVDRHIVDE